MPRSTGTPEPVDLFVRNHVPNVWDWCNSSEVRAPRQEEAQTCVECDQEGKPGVVAIRIVQGGKALCAKHAERYFPSWCSARGQGDAMADDNVEQVKGQESRVMRHLRKPANGRRKRRGRRANGAAPVNGRRASWQKDQELRDMVSRAWSSLALKEQVAVLLQRLAN